MQPKGKVVGLNEFYNWRHEQHNQKKCYCGKFACIGFQYRLGMIELLCFKHYEERKRECHLSKDTVKNPSPKTLKKKSRQDVPENKQSLLL